MKELEFLLNLSKLNSKIYRKLDASLWGIWFNDFIVLYYLNQAIDKKLRRIDLAEKVGLTASGVTRLLLPMEKIWLVSKEVNQFDARVSYVVLAKWWEMKLEEAMDRINFVLAEIMPNSLKNEVEKTTNLLIDFYKNF